MRFGALTGFVRWVGTLRGECPYRAPELPLDFDSSFLPVVLRLSDNPKADRQSGIQPILDNLQVSLDNRFLAVEDFLRGYLVFPLESQREPFASLVFGDLLSPLDEKAPPEDSAGKRDSRTILLVFLS